MGGTLAGIVGGWAFGKWMEQVNFYPLIAGLVGSNSRMLGESLHFLFAVIIGVSFAFLFQREARGYGSSMACGMAYGIFWWFLGPLTILPLWSRPTTGLVQHSCERVVRIADRAHRVWRDRRAALCGSGSLVGAILHRVRSNPPPAGRSRSCGSSDWCNGARCQALPEARCTHSC